MTTQSLSETLRYFATAHDIDIIVGDFNMKLLICSYQQTIQEPTHFSGSILDHCYVKKTFSENYEVTVLVRSIFFSDHECIQILLS